MATAHGGEESGKGMRGFRIQVGCKWDGKSKFRTSAITIKIAPRGLQFFCRGARCRDESRGYAATKTWLNSIRGRVVLSLEFPTSFSLLNFGLAVSGCRVML